MFTGDNWETPEGHGPHSMALGLKLEYTLSQGVTPDLIPKSTSGAPPTWADVYWNYGEWG